MREVLALGADRHLMATAAPGAHRSALAPIGGALEWLSDGIARDPEPLTQLLVPLPGAPADLARTLHRSRAGFVFVLCFTLGFAGVDTREALVYQLFAFWPSVRWRWPALVALRRAPRGCVSWVRLPRRLTAGRAVSVGVRAETNAIGTQRSSRPVLVRTRSFRQGCARGAGGFLPGSGPGPTRPRTARGHRRAAGPIRRPRPRGGWHGPPRPPGHAALVPPAGPGRSGLSTILPDGETRAPGGTAVSARRNPSGLEPRRGERVHQHPRVPPGGPPSQDPLAVLGPSRDTRGEGVPGGILLPRCPGPGTPSWRTTTAPAA